MVVAERVERGRCFAHPGPRPRAVSVEELTRTAGGTNAPHVISVIGADATHRASNPSEVLAQERRGGQPPDHDDPHHRPRDVGRRKRRDA